MQLLLTVGLVALLARGEEGGRDHRDRRQVQVQVHEPDTVKDSVESIQTISSRILARTRRRRKMLGKSLLDSTSDGSDISDKARNVSDDQDDTKFQSISSRILEKTQQRRRQLEAKANNPPKLGEVNLQKQTSPFDDSLVKIFIGSRISESAILGSRKPQVSRRVFGVNY